MKSRADTFLARFCRWFAICGIVSLLACLVSYAYGVRINRTASLPMGLYRVVEKSPERGDIVAFWPQDTEAFRLARRRGYILPGVYNRNRGEEGYGLLLKRLVAVPGDVVRIDENGVTVNGALLPNTRPLSHDNVGDPLPVVRFADYRLGDDEALFISDHMPRSFDGRYFGVQSLRQIVEVVIPLFIF